MGKSDIVKQSFGIDISKADFHVRLINVHRDGRLLRRSRKKFTQSIKGFTKFEQWIGNSKIADASSVFVMEATGVYHEDLAYHLHDLGHRVSIVLPNKIKAYSRSFNEKSKNDEIDADLIARLGAERDLRIWKPAHQNTRQLKRLNRQRQVFVSERIEFKNRLHAVLHSEGPLAAVVARYEDMITYIDQHIKAIEQDIKELCEQEQALNEKVEILKSIPGVGQTTAVAVIAETGAMELFKSREQLVSYTGLDVVTYQSGSSVNKKGRISKKGNVHLRTALYMSAVSLIRSNGPFKDLYLRVLTRSGVKKKALIAVQRKLLIVMYALIKNNTTYNVERHRQRSQKQVGEPKLAYTDSVSFH